MQGRMRVSTWAEPLLNQCCGRGHNEKNKAECTKAHISQLDIQSGDHGINYRFILRLSKARTHEEGASGVLQLSQGNAAEPLRLGTNPVIQAAVEIFKSLMYQRVAFTNRLLEPPPIDNLDHSAACLNGSDPLQLSENRS
jgi:hypothetical protein